MKKISIFLASSKELEPERRQFEIEIYRKTKAWFDDKIFLHLDIWEDLSAQMSLTGSQSEYNEYVKKADIFILLAYTKVGMYTAEEFTTAFGEFQSLKKPFIFTYFKNSKSETEDSLTAFQQKLANLGHFYSPFEDSNDLWNQFNKELDRLKKVDFGENKKPEENNTSTKKNIDITQSSKKEYHQTADKIINVDNVDNFTIN